MASAWPAWRSPPPARVPPVQDQAGGRPDRDRLRQVPAPGRGDRCRCRAPLRFCAGPPLLLNSAAAAPRGAARTTGHVSVPVWLGGIGEAWLVCATLVRCLAPPPCCPGSGAS